MESKKQLIAGVLMQIIAGSKDMPDVKEDTMMACPEEDFQLATADDSMEMFAFVRRRYRQRKRENEILADVFEAGTRMKTEKIISKKKTESFFSSVHLLEPDVFKNYFRLTRSGVEELERMITPNFKAVTAANGRSITPLRTRLLVTLWALATQETFREISIRFGTSIGTANEIFKQICQFITESKETYIKWPSNCQSVADGFQYLSSAPFPGAVGALGITDINIVSAVHMDRDIYSNGKSERSYSIKLQAVCDIRKRFLDVYAGHPGASHASAVWCSCDLFKLLSCSELPAEYHLLGGAAYPLTTFLMTPYDNNNGQLSANQIRFNNVLNSSRLVLGSAFKLLKGRFRRLLRLKMNKVTDMAVVVTAACVLHNFIQDSNIETGNDDTDYEYEEEDDTNAHDGQHLNSVYSGFLRNTPAEDKRNRICLELNKPRF